jgi:type II restriction/modification system DNA methylase subunit YeeA
VGNDPRYTVTTTFETYPFQDGLTPNDSIANQVDDPRLQRIASAAKRLNELRENWLNAAEVVTLVPEVRPGYPDRVLPKSEAAGKELQKRTLTNPYNANPSWLQHTSKELDEAVAASYGWEWPLADEEILKRLFDLNQARSMPLDLRPQIKKPSRKAKQ